MRSVLITGCTVAIATAIALPGSARATTPCGGFVSHGAPVHAKVIRGAPSCRTARRVLARDLSSTASCSGSACVRYRAGWACSSSLAAFPRMASCSRGRAVVAAYRPPTERHRRPRPILVSAN
jgi:hypothetical protein